MTAWNNGYVTDVPYTSNFYREITPRWLVTAATLLGKQAPNIEGEYTYCELGCGQGFGAALIAASNPNGRFWAMDFNPAQIVNARRLATAAGLANIEFIEASFDEFANSSEGTYPQFDFIVMHGIYSWVSRENQKVLIRILNRFLKPGGIVYSSYNCHPGWAPFVPAQKAIELHARHNPDRSDHQAVAGLRFLQRLRDAGAKAFTANSALGGLVDMALEQNKNYLAHEYLDSNWFIHNFADVCQDMAGAKLGYIGSAHLQDNLNNLSVPAKVIPMLEEIRDPALAETVKDLARNQNFRRDIYVRGALAMTELEYRDALLGLSLLPLLPLPAGEIKFRTSIGEFAAKDSVYRPLLEHMSKAPLSFTQAAAHPSFSNHPLTEVAQAFVLLIAGGYAHPVHKTSENNQPDWTIAQAFNRVAIDLALRGHDFAYLAAPAIGSGIAVQFYELAAAKAILKESKVTGQALVEAVWQSFVAAKRLMLKNNQPLETVQENIAELTSILRDFEMNTLPIWRRLGVLPH